MRRHDPAFSLPDSFFEGEVIGVPPRNSGVKGQLPEHVAPQAAPLMSVEAN